MRCSADSFPLAFQDSARKLEENVYYFGRTVETLLLRFGKVPSPLQPSGWQALLLRVREVGQHL